jgi:hypothetical protein
MRDGAMADIPINRQFKVAIPPSLAIQKWQASYTPWFASHGYQQTGQGESVLTYTRSYFPWWTILLAIILFPIGLLALLLKAHAILTVSFEPEGEGATVSLGGMARNQEFHSYLFQIADQWSSKPAGEWGSDHPAAELGAGAAQNDRGVGIDLELDQLQKLVALRDARALTDEEFQERKSRILGDS